MSASVAFTLTSIQVNRLLELRAAGEEGEGEERLEQLRLHEEDAETLRAISQLLSSSGLAGGGVLTRPQMARLLTLVRTLAPNPNLDARLLQRPDEPELLNLDLRDLLYGAASVPGRLRQFLLRRHAGAQTALQLLSAAYPMQWPLVTRAGMRTLDLSGEQRAAALAVARERYELVAVGHETDVSAVGGPPDSDPVLRILADVVAYDAARETLAVTDYVTVHRVLTQGQSSRYSTRRRATFTSAPGESLPAQVRASERPDYVANGSAEGSALEEPSMEAALASPPDVAGLLQRDLLTAIEREVAAQGFTYPLLVIRDYYLCLQSRGRLTILSGLSGTGKTRLSSLFTSALTANLDAQYRLLPVRPDWADSTPLLGYVNLLAGGDGRFVSTPFLEFVRRAGRPENAYRAYFLCLDEMNLARVEHYFAEVLSAMETPNRQLLLPNGQELVLPSNLFITGTLNVDESTHSLSRKVLDRANTILFREVSLHEETPRQIIDTETIDSESVDPASIESPETGDWPHALRQVLFLQARTQTPAAARAKLRDLCGPASGDSEIPQGKSRKQAAPRPDDGKRDLAKHVIATLAEVNALLEPHDLHFAYRVRDEILIYCANSFDVDGAGLLTPEAPGDADTNLRTALDLQLTQKVLPRLTGTQEQVEIPARDLLRWAQRTGFVRTARRLTRLLARLQRDGFAGLE